MSLAVGYSDQYWDLKTYLLIGNGAEDRPYPSFWTMFDEKARAHNMAMAWLVAGFATRIINLKMGERAWAYDAPVLEGRYGNLQSVQAVHPEITKFSMQVVPPEAPWPITAADFKTWLIAMSNRTPTWTGAQPSSSQQVSAQSIIVPTPSVLIDTLSPEQRAIMNMEIPGPITEGVQHIASGVSNAALCGCVGHKEPDWPHHQPLSRSVVYCQDCLDQRVRCHDDYMRGWGRAQHHLEVQYRMSVQPGDETPMPADYGGVSMPVLWEEDALPQAEPIT